MQKKLNAILRICTEMSESRKEECVPHTIIELEEANTLEELDSIVNNPSLVSRKYFL